MMPFAAAIPAFSIALFALGLTANDGLLILFGLFSTVVAAILRILVVLSHLQDSLCAWSVLFESNRSDMANCQTDDCEYELRKIRLDL
ncbi:MAG: exopolysaccharide biosynthesis protein [Candidatus Competibacteraceae bacterium]